MSLRAIKTQFVKDLKGAATLEELETIRVAYLGRKGKLTEVLRGLKDASASVRRIRGAEANALKEHMRALLARQHEILAAEWDREQLAREWIDISAPGRRAPHGHLHPLTRIRREIERIFNSLGFSIVDGPEVETEYHNFDALNIPSDHPAREMQDTFWLEGETDTTKAGGSPLLLRTQTSSVQIRYMRTHTPPFRIISSGRVYRFESTDASHDIQFHQVEGLMIGRDISVAHFKSVMQIFFERLFGHEVAIRLRPGYFPFVEPGFEIDISCLACGGSGCSVCKHSGWVELLGAGMVHPNVLKEVGYVPHEWQGFAFGIGYDRIAMMKYGIEDIRQFRSGDIRFLSRL